jgi:hypothetical protein
VEIEPFYKQKTPRMWGLIIIKLFNFSLDKFYLIFNMIFNLYKINIKKFIKGIFQFSLSLMILSSSFHFYEHNHSKEYGYNICNPGCETSDHHTFNDDCERCINNRNQKIIINYSHFDNHIKNKSVSNFIDIFIFNKYIVYSLSFSRPPPAQIT